ncbi:ATP-binding protein [bacterium]|nr:ATP-binding protein [bacterium]
MENPFVYWEIVSGDNFCDRKEEIRGLLLDIKNSQNVIVISPRRYGKTSLIHAVLKKAKKQGILTFYIDLYSAISKDKLIQVYASSIANEMKGKVERVIDSLKRVLPHLMPQITLDQHGSVSFSFAYDKNAEITPITKNLFEAIYNKAKNEKKKAVVVFDEIQEITKYGDEEIERQMRSSFQKHRQVSYIFMGSKKFLMTEMFYDAGRAFYKFGKHIFLKKLQEKPLSDFVRSRFEDTDFEITDDALKHIIDKTERHPYYTQLLSHILWNNNLETRKISTESVEEGINRLIIEESPAYLNIWDPLTLRQKQVLLAVAKSGGSNIYAQGYIKRNNLPAVSTIQAAIGYLFSAGIIDKLNGYHEISDIFFREWLRKNF